MTLRELLESTSRADLDDAIARLFPKDVAFREEYGRLVDSLASLNCRRHPMRISIEAERFPSDPRHPDLQVVGRDGSLNRDLPDWAECSAPGEFDEEEATYSLTFVPWSERLGMAIDPPTLQAIPGPDVLAYVLKDLSFYGLSPNDTARVLDDVRRRVDKSSRATPQSQRRSRISADGVIASLKRRLA